MTWLLMNWKLVLLGTALAAVLGLSTRLTYVTAERDALSAELRSISEISKAQKEQSEFNAKVINDAIPLMVSEAQKNAIINFKAKFGSTACYLGSGIAPSGLLHSYNSNDQANGAEVSHGAGEQFVADCASDARRLQGWQEWAIAEKLEAK